MTWADGVFIWSISIALVLLLSWAADKWKDLP